MLERARDWVYSSRLKINEDKTQNLLCTLKSGLLKEEEAPARLLGFWVDPKFSWNQRIANKKGMCQRQAFKSACTSIVNLGST